MLHVITKNETALPIFNTGICPRFYLQIVTGLLKKYYGVELNDTYLDDSFVIAQAISDEMHPYEIVTEWADECGASKISSSLFESSLSLDDERTIINALPAVLWAELGNIDINDDGEIESDWLHFNAGTQREEIWHWFESEFDVSVAQLMGVAG